MSKVVRLDVTVFLICVLLFALWPELDKWFTAWFYDGSRGVFIGRESAIVTFFYWVFAYVQIPLLIGLIVAAVYFSYLKAKQLRRNSLFLLCCLLLGPGLLVNVVLKDNSFGRPRPHQTLDYGGQHDYVAVFEYSDQCQKNCSFTSGHASIVFLLVAVFWLTALRRYVFLGVVLGGLLGLMRIAQGAHFLSDVVFSFWAVYFCSLALSYPFGLQRANYAKVQAVNARATALSGQLVER